MNTVHRHRLNSTPEYSAVDSLLCILKFGTTDFRKPDLQNISSMNWFITCASQKTNKQKEPLCVEKNLNIPHFQFPQKTTLSSTTKELPTSFYHTGQWSNLHSSKVSFRCLEFIGNRKSENKGSKTHISTFENKNL